jgi:cytochrome c biogenesis protein CcmG, thiol:disulfide interchange protein DsbE
MKSTIGAFATLLLLAMFALAARAEITVDQPAAMLDTKLLNGKTIKAKDLKGKVVVQMVWATWCPICRTELPELQKLYDEKHDQGLEVMALSIDDDARTVRDFWKGKGYSMPVGMRSDSYFDHYGRVSATPTYYIIDKQGIVRHKLQGPLEAGKLEALLKPLY